MAFGMVLLFGCFAFAGGIATVIAAARSGRAGSSWGALLVEGLLGIAIGVLAVLWPASTALAFVWLIGAWAFLSGVLEIACRDQAAQGDRDEWVLGIAGALSIAFGLLMFYRPLAGGVAVVWWLGAYALISGVMMIVLGFRLRELRAHAPGASFPRRGCTSGSDPNAATAAIRSGCGARRTTRTTGNGSRRPTTG